MTHALQTANETAEASFRQTGNHIFKQAFTKSVETCRNITLKKRHRAFLVRTFSLILPAIAYSSLSLPALAKDDGRIYSRDHKYFAHVEADPPLHKNDPEICEPQPATIRLTDVATGKSHQLFPKGKRIVLPGLGMCMIECVDSLCFSNDGNEIYFGSKAWTTSSAVLSIDVKTGKVKFVSDGNSVKVIAQGKWKDNLIINQHRYYRLPKGGSYDWYYVFNPAGKELAVYSKQDI